MRKLVIVINNELGSGLAANTAAVLALSIGAKHPELIGKNLHDASGQTHIGITTIPIIVLAADGDTLVGLVQKVHDTDIELVSFSKIAQSVHTYEEYAEKLSSTLAADIAYSGIALFGPQQAVTSLVGSLPRFK